MPVSVNKMLMRGAEVIQMCIPVGHSSEEGMEAKHKDIRLQHTWKTSRTKINEDMIHWLLIMSDPIIASYSIDRSNILK